MDTSSKSTSIYQSLRETAPEYDYRIKLIAKLVYSHLKYEGDLELIPREGETTHHTRGEPFPFHTDNLWNIRGIANPSKNTGEKS